MSGYETGVRIGIAVCAAAAGFAGGYFFCKRQYDIFDTIEYIEDDISPEDFGRDTDGDYYEVYNPNTENHISLGEKPDIFEIGERAFKDYAKAASNAGKKLSEEFDEAVSVIKNAFDKPDYISIISEDEAKDVVADGYDTMTATYFVEDDILAGFDNDLEELNIEEFELLEGVNALMNSENQSGQVFVKNDNEQIVYELVASSVKYDDAVKETE